MNLKAVRDLVTSRVGRQILTARKHSPTILFAAGAVGVVATVVLACKATLKLEEVLEEAQDDLERARELQSPKYTEEDRQKDVVLIYVRTGAKLVKLYGPAFILGALSVAALTGSHIILNKRYLGVTAAYAGLDKAFRQYRERVIGELGKDKDDEFRYGVREMDFVDETEEGAVVKTARRAGLIHASPYARWFDEGSSCWSPQPGYNVYFLKTQMSIFNDMLKARGHLFLNEVYDGLGLKRSREGAQVGWILGNGDDYVDFGIFNDNQGMRDFVGGWNKAVLLDFNVDGIIYDKI